MGFLNKLIGFRWSLYIVKDESQIAYAMHENSVIRIVGYVMSYFSNGSQPLEPWSLYLNFNHNHKSIKLLPKHFTADGEDIAALLIEEIEAIDPGWKVKGGEPVFEEAATKKRLRIQYSAKEVIDNAASNKPLELTFFDILDEIFNTQAKVENPAPTAFESLAAICKFIAVSKISPEFYTKHNHSIEISCSFIRVLAGNYPALNNAFRESLSHNISEGARLIEQATVSLELSEEKIQWFDNQMTATLQTLLPVVQDPELPEWISEFKWAIERAFYE